MTEPRNQPETGERPGADEAAEPRYGLSPDLLTEIEQALDEERTLDVEALIAPLHSADLADLLEHLHPDDRVTVVGLLRPRLATDPEFLTYLNEDVRADILDLLKPEELAPALAELDSDDALDLIEDLDEADRAKVLAGLPAIERHWAEEGLGFPEYSAGRLMQREFVALPMFWTVGRTIDWLRTAGDLPDEFHTIYTIDPMHRPTGEVPLSRLVRTVRSARLADLASPEVRAVPAVADQEQVAHLFRHYGLVSAPVVDDAGRLIGVITVDDVVDVIEEEAEEDLLRMGGVSETDIYRDVVHTSRARFTWLVINLGTAFLASAVIGLFESAITQIVALAVLMPIVASMGGNAGTQTLTVAVRALAMNELTDRNARRVVWKEILVGAINGLLFALITGIIAAIWFSQPMLAVVIGAAMVINLIAAGLAGTVIPLALQRLKVDPAVSSAVFLTTVTDVVGFFSFLGLAVLILL